MGKGEISPTSSKTGRGPVEVGLCGYFYVRYLFSFKVCISLKPSGTATAITRKPLEKGWKPFLAPLVSYFFPRCFCCCTITTAAAAAAAAVAAAAATTTTTTTTAFFFFFFTTFFSSFFMAPLLPPPLFLRSLFLRLLLRSILRLRLSNSMSI